MTKQRSRPSLGQAALMTGLLGVGGWLASSALSPNDANAAEMPLDPAGYASTVQPDPGTVDLKQLANSVLDQVSQLRANGHDFSVGVAQQGNDIPAALRSAPGVSDSRKAWQRAGQLVAAAPSSSVLPRSSTPAVTRSTEGGAPSQSDDADAVPVTPTRQHHSRSGNARSARGQSQPDASPTASLPAPASAGTNEGGTGTDGGRMYPLAQTSAATPDPRDDDQTNTAANISPSALVPLGALNNALSSASADDPGEPDAPAVGASPGDETASAPAGDPPSAGGGSDDTGDDDGPGAPPYDTLPDNGEGPLGAGNEVHTEIPDDVTTRDRLGSNFKDSRNPFDIKDTSATKTLFSKASDLSNDVGQAEQVITSGTIKPPAGLEVQPGTDSPADFSSLPFAAAIIWQQLNERVYKPIKSHIEAGQALRAKLQEQQSVTGESPFPSKQGIYLDDDSDATVLPTFVKAGATSAELTDPDAEAALGDVPVDRLPAPPPMHPYGWRANTLDPDEEANGLPLSDEQQLRNLAEREVNGRPRFVQSKGSIGNKQGTWQSSSGAEDEPEPQEGTESKPLSDEEFTDWLAARDSKPSGPSIGNFRNTQSGSQPQEEPQSQEEQPQDASQAQEHVEQEPAPSASATSQAQEEADAAAEAASAAQEQADLNAEGATIKANAAQSQEEEQTNVAASQAQNAAAEEQEQRTQAEEAATEEQAEEGLQRSEAQAANAEAAQETANQAAAFNEQQQEEAAAELSRPAGASGESGDIAGEDDGADAVPETGSGDSGDSGDSEAAEEPGAPAEEEGAQMDGEPLTPQEQFEQGFVGYGGGGGGEEGGAGGDFIEG